MADNASQPETFRDLSAWLAPQIWRNIAQRQDAAGNPILLGFGSPKEGGGVRYVTGPRDEGDFHLVYRVCEGKGSDEASAVRSFLRRLAELYPGEGRFLVRRTLCCDTMTNYATNSIDYAVSFRAAKVPERFLNWEPETASP
jgi:hypothetical protein